MYQQLIDYTMNTALRHKAVSTAKFQGRQYINQQNGNGYMQFIVEDDPYCQYILTRNIFTMTLNIDILAFPTKEYSVLQAQSEAFQVGNEIITYFIKDRKYKNLLDIYDYSFIGLSDFTDDKAAGQRLTLELVIPNPTNLCSLNDNFMDEVEVKETDNEITLKELPKTNNITLKPIRL